MNAKIFLGPKTKWKPCKNGWRKAYAKLPDGQWVDVLTKDEEKPTKTKKPKAETIDIKDDDLPF